MESADHVDSPAWSLWAKLVSPALLRYPVLGISAVLVVSTPIAAMARAVPHSQESASSAPTQRQLRVLRSYERYLARVRTQTVKAGRAVRFAYRQIGKPYQWGGAGPRTYDCSGLVMAAWRKAGLRLPHRADLQHQMIRRRVGIKHLQPGDLVFFSGDHHVGIYVGRNHFLHAPHTGARVQRGTLSGWRLRAFAGAARPGAPVYHAWPHWVRALADQEKGTTHRSPGRPATGRTHAAPPPDSAQASEPDTGMPSDGPSADVPPSDESPDVPPSGVQPPAGEPSGTSPAAPDRSPAESAPSTGAGPALAGGPHSAESGSAAPGGRRPAESAPLARGLGGGLLSPIVTMSARGSLLHVSPARTAEPGGRAIAADTRPAPPPAPTSGAAAPAPTSGAAAPAPASGPASTSGATSPSGTAGHWSPRPHWPRTSVKRQHDEQRFDRDYDDASVNNDDGDTEPAGDGIDWRALLGDAP